MNILIACHDKFDNDHPPIYITNDITKKSIQYNIYTKKGLADAQKEFGIARVDYIDTRAEKLDDNQFNDWSKLPVKYDIVFHVHCPTYGLFHDDADNMPKKSWSWMDTPKYLKTQYDFYFNVKKVLKPNGYLQIPFNYRLNKDGNMENKTEGRAMTRTCTRGHYLMARTGNNKYTHWARAKRCHLSFLHTGRRVHLFTWARRSHEPQGDW